MADYEKCLEELQKLEPAFSSVQGALQSQLQDFLAKHSDTTSELEGSGIKGADIATLRSKLTEQPTRDSLLDAANYALNGQPNIGYFIGINRLQTYFDGYTAFKTKESQCIPPVEAPPVEVNPKPKDPEPLPARPEKVCESDPRKWGVRFTYKVKDNCSQVPLEFKATQTSKPVINSSAPSDLYKQLDARDQFVKPPVPTSDSPIEYLGVDTKDWYMTLLPSMQTILPKQGARDTPNAMPGLQFRAANKVVKHPVPGMGPIYQNMGVDSLFITLVGTFTGDGGLEEKKPVNPFTRLGGLLAPPQVALQTGALANTSDLTNALTDAAVNYSLYGSDSGLFLQDGCPGSCPPPGSNWRDVIDVEWMDSSRSDSKTLGEIAANLDAYKEFTSFYKMAYSEGRHLEVEINMRRNRDGLKVKANPLDPNNLDAADPLRDKGGNPKFKGYIRRLESYLQYSDRMWYLIEVEVTDHGDVTDKPLNLTNVVRDTTKDESVKPSPLEEKVKDLDCLKPLADKALYARPIGSGERISVLANGELIHYKGTKVKAQVPADDAIRYLLWNGEVGDEAKVVNEYLSAVMGVDSVTVTYDPSSSGASDGSSSSSTMTLGIWESVKSSGGYKSYPLSNLTANDGSSMFLYVLPSGRSFLAPNPDSLYKNADVLKGIRILPPNETLSYLASVTLDSRETAYKNFFSTSVSIRSKQPCIGADSDLSEGLPDLPATPKGIFRLPNGEEIDERG